MRAANLTLIISFWCSIDPCGAQREDCFFSSIEILHLPDWSDWRLARNRYTLAITGSNAGFVDFTEGGGQGKSIAKVEHKSDREYTTTTYFSAEEHFGL
jgi:hypothetical protein